MPSFTLPATAKQTMLHICAKSYCCVIYSFLCECTGLLCTSTVQAHSDTKGTSTAAGSPPAILHPDISFFMGKAQCDDAIETQQSDARSSGCLKCRFSCSAEQRSRKPKQRHCLGASPLRTLDVDVGEWSIPHTRKRGVSVHFSRISLRGSSQDLQHFHQQPSQKVYASPHRPRKFIACSEKSS